MKFTLVVLSALAITYSIAAAPTADEVVDANGAYTQQVNDAQDDLEQVNDANALLKARASFLSMTMYCATVEDDLAQLSAGLTTSLKYFKGTAPSSDEDEEESLGASFDSFAEILVEYTRELVNKKTALTLGLEKAKIHLSLEYLQGNFTSWALFNQGLVATDAGVDDGMKQQTASAIEALVEAENQFE